MTHSTASAAKLLVENLSLLQDLAEGGGLEYGVLDLACGRGRHGRVVLDLGIPVTFADRDGDSLACIASECAARQELVTCWQVDLEREDSAPLAGRQFDAILVFNYLHRPLMTALKQAVRPGGLVFYETFTLAQRFLGRPKNPDFLLQPGELNQTFADWQIVHSFEGQLPDPVREVANVIARRP